jgi:hypothetical protein
MTDKHLLTTNTLLVGMQARQGPLIALCHWLLHGVQAQRGMLTILMWIARLNIWDGCLVASVQLRLINVMVRKPRGVTD